MLRDYIVEAIVTKPDGEKVRREAKIHQVKSDREAVRVYILNAEETYGYGTEVNIVSVKETKESQKNNYFHTRRN